MPGDINSYALELDLSLADHASQTIGNVSNQLDDLQAQLVSIAKTGLGSLENTQDITDSLADQLISHQDINKEAKEAIELGKERGDQLTLEQKSYADVFDTVDDTVDSMESIVAEGIEWVGGLTAVAATWVVIEQLIDRTWDAMNKLIDLEEEFYTINYRLQGSQRELSEDVYRTAREYNILGETSLEAYQKMALGLRIPKEELGKYVEMTTYFNRITDVSIDTTYRWIRQQKLAGFTAAQSEHQLRTFAQAMKAAGMTTEEISSLMRTQTDRTAERFILYGKEMSQVMQQNEAQLASLGSHYGVQTQTVTDFTKAIETNYVAMARARAEGERLGMAQGTMSDAQFKNAKMISGGLSIIDKAYQGVDQTAKDWEITMKATMGAHAKTMGISTEQAYEMATMMARMRDEGYDTADMYAAMQAKFPDWQRQQDLSAAYQKSIGTLAATWERLWVKMDAAFMALAVAFAPQLDTLLIALDPIITGLALIVEWIAAVAKAFMIVLSPVVYLVRWIAILFSGIIEGVRSAFQPFIAVIDMVFDAIYGGGTAIAGFEEKLKTVGKWIGWVAGIISFVLIPSLLQYVFVQGVAAYQAIMRFYNALLFRVAPAIWNFGMILNTTVIPAIVRFAKISLNNAIIGIWAFAGALYNGAVAAWNFATALISSAITAIGGFITAMGTATAAVWTFIVSLLPIIWPILAIAAVIGLLVAAIWWLWEPIKQVFVVAFGWVADIFNWVIAEISAASDSFFNLGNVILWLLGPIGWLVKGIMYLCDWFGQSGAGLIEEAGWAASALELLAAPAMIIERVLRAVGQTIWTVVNAFSALIDKVVELGSESAGDLIKGGAALITFAGAMYVGAGLLFGAGIMLLVSAPLVSAGLTALAFGLWMVDPERLEKVSFGLARLAESMGLFAEDVYKSATGMIALGVALGVFGLTVAKAAPLIGIAGFALLTASASLAVGIVALNAALWLFSTDLLHDITDAFDAFADSLGRVVKVAGEMGSLKSAIAGAISDVEGCGEAMYNAYASLAMAIDAGMDKVDAATARASGMATPLKLLAASLGMNIADVVNAQDAVAKPAVADTITQVQVMAEEGGPTVEGKAEHRLAEQTNKTLLLILERLNDLDVGENEDIKAINRVVSKYLPKLGQSPAKLGTNMSDWS